MTSTFIFVPPSAGGSLPPVESLVWTPSLLPTVPPLIITRDVQNVDLNPVVDGVEITATDPNGFDLDSVVNENTNFNGPDKKGFYFQINSVSPGVDDGLSVSLTAQNFVNNPTLEFVIFNIRGPEQTQGQINWRLFDPFTVQPTGIEFTEAELLDLNICVVQFSPDNGLSYTFEYYLSDVVTGTPVYTTTVAPGILINEVFLGLRVNAGSPTPITNNFKITQFTTPPFLYPGVDIVTGNAVIDPASYPASPRGNKTYIIDGVAEYPQSVNSVLGPVSDGISITFDANENPAGRTIRSLNTDLEINAYNSGQ